MGIWVRCGNDPALSEATVLFAIEAVLDLAHNSGDTPVRSADVTERQGIPGRYSEPVLQELVREGILVGIRGPRGGYRLAREANRINLGDIVRTVKATETAPDPVADPAGSPLGQQVLRPLWLELQEKTMRRLDQITLEHLPRRAKRAGI